MAKPRVFVSSTCYDLKEIRDNLYEFIVSLGYIPVFSDKNEVFYHPDLHTHESCLKEIESCQLFVLIIGGRFGGTYKYDDKKSIVNAEYDAGKKLGLPIFTFVQKDVSSNQFTYSRNLKNNIADKIDYPAIADQKYAKNIFEFIINIRRTDENNGLFEFEFTRDIKTILRTQFAGLFYDFLWNRNKMKEANKTKDILFNLSSISKKTEELIENIYKKVEVNDSETLIKQLDLEEKSRKFWYFLLQTFNLSMFHTDAEKKESFSKIEEDENDWINFILKRTENFKIVNDTNTKVLTNLKTNKSFGLEFLDTGEVFEPNERDLELVQTNFDAFKKLTEEKRFEVLKSIEI